MRESQHLVFGLRLVRRIFEETLTHRNPNQKSATLRRSFSSNESAPANRKKGFYTNRNPNKQEDSMHFCMNRFRTLNSFQIFKIKIKKSRTYSGWCSFQGISNNTTLMQIQSGRTVHLKIPNPKCRLYWCLIEFIGWSCCQSGWYFRPALWTIAPLTFSLVCSPSPFQCE